ncbi:MAG TPA: 4Fe-4S dicluster domain-containing protein [Acidimicrobiales bacterium]|nr:4Fe-4S dicluster domain-containing protein [Acidimicrobiales bacterium]
MAERLADRLYGVLDDVAADAGYDDPPVRMGFFTDTSVCIGCKACEVACKEWNLLPEDGMALLGSSYDNTGRLGASTWRHVKFVEQSGRVAVAPGRHTPGSFDHGATPPPEDDGDGLRWLMASDVCKHCTHAACLDVCPTGALIRTELGTVVVQSDVCNGCGYCVPACPFGVIEIREGDGRAFKCTLCYDRTRAGLEPACATACPTNSIQYGPLDELRHRAAERAEELRRRGAQKVQLYGERPDDGIGGAGAFFLLLDDPEVYGLPPDPVVTTRDLPRMWAFAAGAAAAVVASVVASFAGRRK